MPIPNNELNDYAASEAARRGPGRRDTAGMTSTPTGYLLLQEGLLVVPMGTGPRTETSGVANGTVHAYVAGNNVVFQLYSLALGGWRQVTLTPAP